MHAKVDDQNVVKLVVSNEMDSRSCEFIIGKRQLASVQIVVKLPARMRAAPHRVSS